MRLLNSFTLFNYLGRAAKRRETEEVARFAVEFDCFLGSHPAAVGGATRRAPPDGVLVADRLLSGAAAAGALRVAHPADAVAQPKAPSTGPPRVRPDGGQEQEEDTLPGLSAAERGRS